MNTISEITYVGRWAVLVLWLIALCFPGFVSVGIAGFVGAAISALGAVHAKNGGGLSIAPVAPPTTPKPAGS